MPEDKDAPVWIVRFVPAAQGAGGTIYETVGGVDEAVAIAKRLARTKAYGAGEYSAEQAEQGGGSPATILWSITVTG